MLLDDVTVLKLPVEWAHVWEGGLRNTGKCLGRAARCNSLYWMQIIGSAASHLKGPYSQQQASQCHFWGFHFPAGMSRCAPQASFFFPFHPTFPHQQSPPCCNSSSTAASIVGDKLQHAGQQTVCCWDNSQWKPKGNKIYPRMWCVRGRLMYWYGNNGNDFIEYLATVHQYWKSTINAVK